MKQSGVPAAPRVIWLNGAFGAGKTKTAYELQRRLPGSYVYDPENAGDFIRKNLPPGMELDDFQDYPMWRTINLDMLRYLLQNRPGPVIVPMTVTSRAYYDQLIGGLSAEYEVRHVVLCASRETILRRLAARGEGSRSWAARQIDRCLQAFEGDIREHRITTDHMTIRQVVQAVADCAGLSLAEDSRSRPRRFLDLLVTRRHVRQGGGRNNRRPP